MEQRTWEYYLGRPGKFDKWTHYGAGGRRVCPRVPPGLPAWKQLPLDHRLPYMSAPSNVYLTRGLPAEKLLTRRRAHDFRLFDAYCRELHTPYESLHDLHLKKHFNKDDVVSCSRIANHMNTNKQALASLKKLNEFRQMSRLMNLDHVQFRMNLEDQAATDKKRLQQIEDNFKETQYNWEMERKFKELREQHQEEIKERTKENVKRWQEKLLKKEHQVENLQRFLFKKQRAIQLKTAAREEKVKKNFEHLSQCKRKQLLGLKRKLRERELQLQKKQAEDVSFKAQQQIEQIKQKWESKCAEMTSLNVKSKSIVAHVMETHHANIERRKERAARVKKAQEDLKMFRLLMRKERQSEQLAPKKPKPRDSIMQPGVPELMVNFLIEAAIINYIKKMLTPLISYASRSANEHGFFVLNQLRMDRCKGKCNTMSGKTKFQGKDKEHTGSRNHRSSTISKRTISLESRDDSKLARAGSTVRFENPFDSLPEEDEENSDICDVPSYDFNKSLSTIPAEKREFPEKEKLAHSCEHAVMRILSFAKLIINECVEPRTRAQTIKKLSKYEHCQDELIQILAKSVYQDNLETEAMVAAGLARGAVIAIFNPSEWRKPKSDLAEMRRVLLPL